MFSVSNVVPVLKIQAWLGLAAAFAFLPLTNARAEDPAPLSAESVLAPSEPFAPAEFGRIVYQINGHLPQQIYIIGQAHRSALTGKGSIDIVRVQADIYRIGEWLIQEKKVEMLLPEGFFQTVSEQARARPEAAREVALLDKQSLEARLGDTQRFVNADLLLNASFNIPLGQVENEELYRNIYQLLQEAGGTNGHPALAKLDGLQVERTALMLQKIPDILEEAFQAGIIGTRKAMFTIGLVHVREIIDFLQRGYLWLPGGSGQVEELRKASLKLLDQGYGVTVILPRTLADNEKILRLARFAAQ